MKFPRLIALMLAAVLATASVAPAQAPPPPPDLAAQVQRLGASLEGLNHRLDELQKNVDDALWFDRVGDVAIVEKARITGPPPWKEKNPTAIGAGNPVKFYTYVFLPRTLPKGGKCPLIVLPHGGVHADFTTYHAHIVRELVAQGYVVVAPEYRGSTGYGRAFYEQIDYGGLEIEDCHAARQWAIDTYPCVDGSRTAMVGWSHGGLIALMTVFAHPDDYRCAFAGVPVSDLVQRLGYWGEEYAADFSAPYHIGQTPAENLPEYKRRSPVWNVEKLKTPLLIHTNTNDEDVNVIEVEHLIQALKAAGKVFESEVYQDVPGGHSFDRLDTTRALEIRVKIYDFLARYLDPPSPLRTVAEVRRAAFPQP
ncbi:MAG: alpha/beta hydrolase family protein [Candidatus Krumholzibacteriia bacterium]